MLRDLLCISCLSLAVGCGAGEGSETGDASSAADGEAGSTGSTEAEGSTSTESTESTDDTDDAGEACTDEECPSRFGVYLTHALDLSAGPYQLRIETPTFELICSVGPAAEGNDSCFGGAYVDIEWTETQASVVILDPPWFDAIDNPDGLPDPSAEIRLELEGMTLYQQSHPIEPGEALQPDPCGPVCWDASVELQLEL